MGGTYNWKSEGMGGFHRGDFWSRKSRVSSLKTLLLWKGRGGSRLWNSEGMGGVTHSVISEAKGGGG